MSTKPVTTMNSGRSLFIPAQPRRDDKRRLGRIPATLKISALIFFAALPAYAADDSVNKSTPANQNASTPAPALFSFTRNNVVIDADQSAGEGALVIKMTKPEATAPTVSLAMPSATVKVGDPISMNEAASGEWTIPVTVSGLQRNKSEELLLRVTQGAASESRQFTVTNIPVQSFKWSMLAFGGAASWSSKEPLVTTVSVGPVPAADVTAHAILTDKVTGKRFAAGDLKICASPEPDCSPVSNLQANRPHKLYLVPAGDQAVPSGTYEGTIQLLSAQGEGAAAQTTLHVTSAGDRALGIALIILGVLASFLFSLGVRNRLTRLQLLVPAAAIARSFHGIGERLALITEGHVPAGQTVDSLQKWQERLSRRELTVHGEIPPWYSMASLSSTASTQYQTLLDRAGGWAIALDRIVRTGFTPIADAWHNLHPDDPPAAAKAVLDAAKKMDALSRPDAPGQQPPPIAPDLATLDALIAAIVTAMETALAAARKLQDDDSKFKPSPRELERIQSEIRSLSLTGWGLAAILTIAVGSYVMVLNNLGFGRPTDFLLCILWGFGLPAAGTQALMTMGNVGTAVGVSLPKSS